MSLKILVTKYLFLILLFIAIVLPCNAQKENNIWYFGQGNGLDFNFIPPKVFTFNNVSNVNIIKGYSSVSDKNGRLLFYTDGRTVWNKNQAIMINGENLGKTPTPGQTSIIVKQPAKPIYYLFYSDVYRFPNGASNPNNNYFYAIIDMTSGDGVVTVKNEILAKNAGEKIAIVKSLSKCGYWVVTHARTGNSFYSFFLDSSGVNKQPIVSKVGLEYIFNGPNRSSNANIGYLKFSPNGDKLAAAHFPNHGLEIYDFDKNSGIVSNAIMIDKDKGRYYGFEFSPSGKYLYLGLNLTNDIYQFDMSLPANAISSSEKVVIRNIKAGRIASLQLGPNGKIYVALFSSEYMGVINNPDAPVENVQFNTYGVKLPNIHGTDGLPSFINENNFSFTSPLTLGNDTIVCDDKLVLNSNVKAFSNIIWSTGEQSTSITVTQSGTYWVKVTPNCGDEYGDSINIQFKTDIISSIDLGRDTLLCSDELELILPDITGAKYTWNTGDTTKEIKANQSGMYKAQVTTPICNNTYMDSVQIEFYTPTPLQLTEAITLCQKDFKAVSLSVNADYTKYLWDYGNTTPSIEVNQEGQYTISVTDTCGDTYTQSTTVTICDCNLYVPNTFTPNKDGKNEGYRVINHCGFAIYHLKIFNRWGQLLFQTQDPKQAWDGTYDGKPVTEGIYLISLRYGYKGAKTRNSDYNGLIHLLR